MTRPSRSTKSGSQRGTVTLIHPPLLTQANDKLGSGIVYLPLGLAYLAAILQSSYTVQVIDAFGENPGQVSRAEGKLVQGLKAREILARIKPETHTVIVDLSTIVAYGIVCQLIQKIKASRRQLRVVVVENSQSVIGCSLEFAYQGLLDAGADYIVLGESEERVPRLLEALQKKGRGALRLDGIIYREGAKVRIQPKREIIRDLDRLPFPAWELFPLNHYWSLGYGHGPVESRHLELLTSRGCPFHCNFCVVPATNAGKWRARSPENVVNEMETMVNRFGVREFHWEDLNPTASENRILRICEKIAEKKLDVRWKLASGSKIETLQLKTLEPMRRAGCTFISFSPESGSPRVLQLMNKRFNHAHALKMTARMKELGIASQACFVIGYPGETPDDLEQTTGYVRELAKAGVDEIAIFIMTPIPGTKTYGSLKGYRDISEMTFAPAWREDYPALRAYRQRLYRRFFQWKLIYHPQKFMIQLWSLWTGHYRNKAEMNLYRIFSLSFKEWRTPKQSWD